VFHFRTRASIVLLCLAWAVAGCQRPSQIVRLPVHGAVTVGGESLSGSITFVPAKGESGPAATTKVEEGKYAFDRNHGPTAGPHIVIMRRLHGREGGPSAGGQEPRNNGTECSRTADLADDGQYQCDFAL
jgi:hypothetical protein